MADTFVKKPMVVVGTKDQVVAEMGTNDFGIATDVSFYTAEETDAKLADKQDVATAINYDNISNCITENPQDIKLELNNGTLTLKAGSKVYVPNGSDVFDTRNITTDQTYTQTTDGQYLLTVKQDMSIWGAFASTATSGTTPPAGTGTFYNTTTNSIDWYDGGTYNERHYSLPFALITVSNGAISSIDQIFNGFGYFGSTVFALPGASGLIPNGRNTDGSLKSIKFVNDSVKTRTIPGGDYQLLFDGTDINYANSSDDIYNKKENIIDYVGNGVIIGNCVVVDNRITEFNVNSVFRALDYSNTEYMAHQAMPSARYVDLTLGASGSNYTAPADGYLALSSTFDTAGRLYMYRGAGARYGTTITYIASQWVDSFIPVVKGDIVTIQYMGTASVQSFKFIYANGAK